MGTNHAYAIIESYNVMITIELYLCSISDTPFNKSIPIVSKLPLYPGNGKSIKLSPSIKKEIVPLSQIIGQFPFITHYLECSNL